MSADKVQWLALLLGVFLLVGIWIGWECWRRPLSKLQKTKPFADWLPMRQAQCWCAACDAAQSQFRFRMNLCPDCGDKRCPRAEDHSKACSKTARLAGDGLPCHNTHDPQCQWPHCLCTRETHND